MAKSKGQVVEGAACKVTAGPNKGKVGTYTIDEEDGSVWCEGPWGGTQCATQCTDAAAQVGQVFDYASSSGEVRFEVNGLFHTDSGTLFHVQAEFDAKTKKPLRFSAVRMLPTSIASLKKAKAPLDRAVAEALEPRLEKLARGATRGG